MPSSLVHSATSVAERPGHRHVEVGGVVDGVRHEHPVELVPAALVDEVAVQREELVDRQPVAHVEGHRAIMPAVSVVSIVPTLRSSTLRS